jgi:hypothetical protein
VIATLKTVLFWMLIILVIILVWNFVQNFQTRP